MKLQKHLGHLRRLSCCRTQIRVREVISTTKPVLIRLSNTLSWGKRLRLHCEFLHMEEPAVVSWATAAYSQIRLCNSWVLLFQNFPLQLVTTHQKLGLTMSLSLTVCLVSHTKWQTTTCTYTQQICQVQRHFLSAFQHQKDDSFLLYS